MDILQQELEMLSVEAWINGLPYIHALRAFSRVVGSTFSNALKDKYQQDIVEFKRLYLSLDISVTPKVIYC